MKIDLFSAQNKTIAIAASVTASSSVQLPGSGNSLRVLNEGTSSVYISVGVGVQVATIPTSTALATCTPIAAGQDAVFSIPPDARQNISVIAASGTPNVVISVGEGS